MEIRFEVDYKASKKHIVNYGKIILSKTKANIIYLVMGALMAFLIYPLITIFDTEDTATTGIMTFGMIMIIFGIWFDKLFLSKRAVIKAQGKASLSPSKITFSDEGINFQSEFENSTLNYSVYEKIVETEEAFYLFLGKNQANIVGKEEFVFGTIEDFRTFIAEKTGKKVGFVSVAKKSVTRAIVATVVASALAIGTMFGANFIKNKNQSVGKTFSVENYSITLTQSFEEQTNTEAFLTVYSESKKISVYVYYYSNEELEEYQGVKLENSAEVAQWLIESWTSSVNEVARNISSTETHIESEEDKEGFTYYYYDSVLQVEGGFWHTEFATPIGLKDDYRDDFIEWLKTVEIK